LSITFPVADERWLNAFDDLLGTAVTVQAMVFGNAGGESGSGVAFTRNPATGTKALYRVIRRRPNKSLSPEACSVFEPLPCAFGCSPNICHVRLMPSQDISRCGERCGVLAAPLKCDLDQAVSDSHVV
jgi:hypothetical protein